MIKVTVNGKTCQIRRIRHNDGESLSAVYRGWQIDIYPMWGKLVDGAYRSDLKTGEFGVDVSGPDGCRIVDDVQPTREKALTTALESILLSRPRYGEI